MLLVCLFVCVGVGVREDVRVVVVVGWRVVVVVVIVGVCV